MPSPSVQRIASGASVVHEETIHRRPKRRKTRSTVDRRAPALRSIDMLEPERPATSLSAPAKRPAARPQPITCASSQAGQARAWSEKLPRSSRTASGSPGESGQDTIIRGKACLHATIPFWQQHFSEKAYSFRRTRTRSSRAPSLSPPRFWKLSLADVPCIAFSSREKSRKGSFRCMTISS